MARERTIDPVARAEIEMLRRLGLGPNASASDADAAHAAIVSYLASAPLVAAEWARAQAAAADEAISLLGDRAALARHAESLGRSAGRRTSPPPPAPRPRAVAPPAAAPADPTPPRADDLLDELIAEVTPSAHRDEVRGSPPRRSEGRRPRWLVSRRLPVMALAAGAVVVVLFVVSGFADSSIPAAPGPAASQQASGLDEAAVAALMSRIQEDPNDAEALMSLGDAFFGAGQYDVSAEWLGKLVALEPENTRALLALGAAQFNSGKATEAEGSWKRVVELEPDNVEAHYDLGFLYLQQEPSDTDGMRREWQKVVELAPGTEVATSVQAHLDALASLKPSAVPSEPGR